MATAPQPYLSACLDVVSHALLQGRLIGWAGEHGGLSSEDAKRLADLLDAVHNIPTLITDWENCDEARLRSYLLAYDEKWVPKGHAPLLRRYLQSLESP